MLSDIKTLQLSTTTACIRGGICGEMWWPQSKGGLPVSVDLRAQFERFSRPEGLSFREVFLHILMEKGGDFQNARFTADTIIRVERRAIDDASHSRLHTWERSLTQLPDCTDLIDPECFLSDFEQEAA